MVHYILEGSGLSALISLILASSGRAGW